MKLTIEQHFEQYARGDGADHLARVFDEVAPELGRVARYLVSGKQARMEAADLVQATFLTAIEKAQSYNAERPLVPWLVGILALHARQARGAGARNRELEGLDDSRATDGAIAGTDPQQQAQDKEWRGAVTQAVHNLPENYGRVLRGVLLEGKRPGEVASELALSPTHARVNLHRGLGLLRRLLPGGYAFGLAATLRRPRGLAQVRARVLNAAAGKRVTLATPATLPLGLSLMAGLGLITTLGFALDWGGSPEAPAKTLLAAAPSAATEPSIELDSGSAEYAPATRKPALASLAGSELTASLAPQSAPEIKRTCTGWVRPMGAKQPAADIPVWLETAAGERRIVATTDARGRFEFPLLDAEVPPGSIPLVELQVPGHQVWRVPREREAQERFLRNFSYDQDGPRGRFSIIDPLPAHSIGGRVLDQNGYPVEGALIIALDALGQVTHPRPLARTDSDGYFQAANAVRERMGNSAQQYTIIALAPEGTGYALTLSAGKGQDPSNMELRLTKRAEFRVRVLDAAGRPLAGASVQARPNVYEWSCWDSPNGLSHRQRLWIGDLPSAFTERFTAISDEEGWAQFKNLPSIDSPYVARINDEPLVPWNVQASLAGYAIGGLKNASPLSATIRALFEGDGSSTTLVLHPEAGPAEED